jgi:hypothetical protein
MIFLKRRAFMTFKFNYETSKGIKQVILTNCGQAPFKRFSILGNSHQDSTTGKQLFKLTDNYLHAYFYAGENKKIVPYTNNAIVYLPCEPNTTYTIHGRKNINNDMTRKNRVGLTAELPAFNVKITKATETTLDKPVTITTEEDTKYLVIMAITDGEIGQLNFDKVLENNTSKLMVEVGDKASPYEPYTGGKPSPSPDYPQQIKNVGKWNDEKQKYEVDVRVTGKNLFDKDSVQLNVEFGDANSDFISMKDGWFVSDFIPVFSGKTYFISGKKTGYGYKLYDIDKHFIKNIQLTHGRLSVEDGINYVRINGEMKDLKNIQVELGTTATSYEPYFPEQTATITMDEPLRGIGKYQDKITKDGIARRIRSVMLNGNEDWKFYGSNGNINNFGYILREAISNNVGQRSSLTFSSYKSGVWATDRLGQDMFTRIIRINLPKDVFPDVETLRNWLSQSKTTLQYVLEKEVIVPISQSEQDAIRALTTYHPTTVITVDGGDVDAGIEVEYAVKNKEKI